MSPHYNALRREEEEEEEMAPAGEPVVETDEEAAPLLTHVAIKVAPGEAVHAQDADAPALAHCAKPDKVGDHGATPPSPRPGSTTAGAATWHEGASGSGAPSPCSSPAPDGCVCRICLEEDLPSSMQQPCACSGTQRYAHHACLQRWITEKGHLQCEICAQRYRGSYQLPPPPPPPAEGHLQAPMGSLYLTIYDANHSDVGGRGEAAAAADDSLEEAHPTLSWCYSAMLFLLFMVVLHHTMLLGMPAPGYGPDGMPLPPDAVAAAAAAAANATALATSSSMAAAPRDAWSQGDAQGGGGVVMAAPGAAVFLMWVLTKAVLVAIPLFTVLRIAATPVPEDAWGDRWDGASEDGATPRAAARHGRSLVLTVRAAPATPDAAAAAAAGAGGGGAARGALASTAGLV